MNSSLLRSDRATHLRIGVTAVLATTLVIVVGICAQPPGAAHAPAVQSVGTPTMAVEADRGLAATR
jgi:hypothetical protein